MADEMVFDLFEEVGKFFETSSIAAPGGEPKFVLLMGGVAAGKTTIRKQKYSQGYVVLDAGEIFLNLSRGVYYNFGDIFEEPLDLIGYGIAFKAIQQRRNIVTEITGGGPDGYDQSKAVLDAMLSVGYKVEVMYVHCDVEAAAQRNVDRGDDNISAYYAGPYHCRWLLEAVSQIRAGSMAERGYERLRGG
jgi:hypothetical protein